MQAACAEAWEMFDFSMFDQRAAGYKPDSRTGHEQDSTRRKPLAQTLAGKQT